MSETIESPRPASKPLTDEPNKQMKAIIRTSFGPPRVLQLQTVETPNPKEGQVLVKVEASSINPADRYTMQGMSILLRAFLPLFKMNMGVRKPKDPMLGSDLAGTVVATGANVTQLHIGDEVFGVSAPGAGSYAEYANAREVRLALKPSNVSFEQAAAVPIAAITALQALRDKGNVHPGQKVLVNGAGGGVGTYAVQIAKALGAEVTAVSNTENLGLMRQLGVDHIIDYTKQDFTKNGQRYDVVCDIASKHGFSDYKRSLNPGGRCVIVGWKGNVILRLFSFAILRPIRGRGDKKFLFFIAKITDKDLNFLGDLLETGRMVSVIDRRYPLSETADAMRRLEEGGVRGKIIIATGQD